MKEKVKVDSKGKVLIPPNFRKKIGIESGHKLTLELENEEIIITKNEEKENKPDLHELAKRLSDE